MSSLRWARGEHRQKRGIVLFNPEGEEIRRLKKESIDSHSEKKEPSPGSFKSNIVQ